jgi:histidinol dehydrogenase
MHFASPAWRRYLASPLRTGTRDPQVVRRVAGILAAVRRGGDAALVRLTARLDGVAMTTAELKIKATRVRALAARADREVVGALRQMARRIAIYHRCQRDRGVQLRLSDGSLLEERVGPIGSAGLYVPGGAGAYPSSVLMSAIPARIAGVPRIVVATPPRALEASPALAAALVIARVEQHVFGIGGAQAIAALAFGTRRVPAVAKIVGPGNAYVAEAKRQVRGRVEIDLEAGPSEVVVLADDTVDPGWVAADLLAQAEHGSGGETVVLITTSESLARAVLKLVGDGHASVANRAATRHALAARGAAVLVRDLEQGIAATNALAPEHAQVMVRGATRVARRIVAGAVFVGPHSPVAVGDYGIGPNHVLPTGGAARFASPLSVRDFQRRWSRVTMTRAGLRRVARDVARVAFAEGFPGHAQSVLTRLAVR